MATPMDAITAIKESRPPATDYLTYLTIIETHLTPEILPTLAEILKDAELTQHIGWDLIGLLLPLPGSEICLNTIARLGNPREVILKVTEALQILRATQDDEGDFDGDFDEADIDGEPSQTKQDQEAQKEPSISDRFCTLVSLLAILHPRIKTKFPSRFLSTSLMGVLATYRPGAQETATVISFIHALSDKKRPPVPRRTSSSAKIVEVKNTDTSAPDPEATEEDPNEAAIQKRLLQSFATFVYELFVKQNSLQWSARLLERFEPEKIVKGKETVGETFKKAGVLHDWDVIAGQLGALMRDLGLSQMETLFGAIYAEDATDHDDDAPTSPDAIPLSRAGSLYLVAYFIFSSIMLDTKDPIPPISIFPGYAKLLKQFLGVDGEETIGSEPIGVQDSLLTIGLWLEHINKFVSTALEDAEFVTLLRTLSLVAAQSPRIELRNSAHALTTNILHANPSDKVRLDFIVDTLDECPFESLRASAVRWLKEEIITAVDRKNDNAFSSTLAVASTQSYIFPDISELSNADITEDWARINESLSFHLAALNFYYFISGEKYAEVVPTGTLAAAQERYLTPLRNVQKKLEKALTTGGDTPEGMDSEDAKMASLDVALLGERLTMCEERKIGGAKGE